MKDLTSIINVFLNTDGFHVLLKVQPNVCPSTVPATDTKTAITEATKEDFAVCHSLPL